MVSFGFLHIQPFELKLPCIDLSDGFVCGIVESKKQTSCSMQLTNRSDDHIAFKVKTTSPKKYCVRPNSGVILPGMVCNVTVTRQAQKELRYDMHCKDRFLIQSVVVPKGTTSQDMNSEMFIRRCGKVIEEFKVRVVLKSANPPSPIAEESDEGYSPRSSVKDEDIQDSILVDDVTRDTNEPAEEPSYLETLSNLAAVIKEKALVIRESRKLLEELGMLREEKRKRKIVSLVVLVVAASLALLLGYIITNT